jgi:F0F1-type ATP synthase membrane subunit b/b'
MNFRAVTIILGLALLIAASPVKAQSLIVTIALGPNQIGQVKTTQGITTRITFPEPVRDIICGDLYDATTGKGSFVVQRIDNDVFLKPVVAKGMSNLFVKTGEKGDHTYSFDLLVVSVEQAHRVVSVADARGAASGVVDPSANSYEESKKTLNAAQLQADEIIRNARQQADRITTQGNQMSAEVYAKALHRAEELDRQSNSRAQQEVEQRFVRAMIQGVKEVKSTDSHVVAKKVSLLLDPRVLTFDDQSYLRYTIRNNGDKEFSFSGLSLERRAGKETFVIPAKVIQGRVENRLKPGEAIMGIIVFDPKEIGTEDRLTLYVRGEDNAEIARLNIQ